ncbi:MAG: peptidase E [Actinobacteria bacterium]|nr:peptidase E [Actinomycetota bacterium]
MSEPQILAIGGLGREAGGPLQRFLLEASGARRPRVLFVPTAGGDADWSSLRFYESFASLECRPAVLTLFGIPPPDLRALVLEQDVVYVSGGNTANMLAVWRVHGLDRVLREAWERGIVLAGWSAGSICWFEAGVTDSFRRELDGLECLGFLPGSNCPHYDAEEQRRPAYHRLVADGFPSGLAADDGAALHFRGTELAEVVADRPGARGYRVERAGDGSVLETPLPARLVD